MTSSLFLVLLAALSIAAPPSASPVLKASAGLDGVCKPGRWTPVRIEIEANGPVDGELIVEWGGERVVRAVTLASASRYRFEMHIRTTDVRDSISVHLKSEGRDVAVARAPLRLVRLEEPVTLCVSANGVPVDSESGCNTTLSPSALPASWRGYDAADQVVWTSGDWGALSRDQQSALYEWRALQAAQAPGNIMPAAPERPTSAGGPLPRVLFAAYLLTMVGAGVWQTKRRASLRAFLAVACSIVIAGSTMALAAGRIGPASSVTVEQESVVQQFAGVGGSLVTMRALAQYPAFDRFDLRPSLADGVIRRLPDNAAGDEHRFDGDGWPVLSVVSGLGSVQQFELEGMADRTTLEASTEGTKFRVKNTSRFDLYNCAFSPAFSRQHVGPLSPGASVDAVRIDETSDAWFACEARGSLVDFTESSRSVTNSGHARIVYHLAPRVVTRDEE